MIYAEPHINGNTPEDFKAIAGDIYNALPALEEALKKAYGQCFHGRNYQHNPDAGDTSAAPQDLDRAQIEMALEDLNEMRQLAISIFNKGDMA